MVLLLTPTAVELLFWIGDFGCGQPISMSDWRMGMGTIALAQMKNPATSALVAKDMIDLMFCVIVSTGPLKSGTELSLESMIWVPVRCGLF